MRKCLDEMGYPVNTKRRILEMVRSLTKDHKLKYREEKILDAQNRCQLAGTEFIKLCDRLDNIRDSGTMPDGFLTRYLNETESMIRAFELSAPLKDTCNVYTALKKEVGEMQGMRGNPR
jgi:hypothetical protein